MQCAPCMLALPPAFVTKFFCQNRLSFDVVYHCISENTKMGIIREFRVVLPLTVEEYQVGQLYSVAMASKNETGGGDGIEVVTNEPIEHEVYGKCQFTHKVYHLQKKVPPFITLLAPKGSLEVHEEAWNAYPYCKTVISNPDYMKENFYLIIETWHKPGKGEIENVHNLPQEKLKLREVDFIDIVNDPVKNYNAKWDPTLVRSEKTGRGPLTEDWKKTSDPIMCAYKLVTMEFKWWGIQNRMEKFVMKNERILFQNFHRQVFCWLDEYHGMTMDDIRELESKTKEELDEERSSAPLRGMIAKE